MRPCPRIIQLAAEREGEEGGIPPALVKCCLISASLDMFLSPLEGNLQAGVVEPGGKTLRLLQERPEPHFPPHAGRVPRVALVVRAQVYGPAQQTQPRRHHSLPTVAAHAKRILDGQFVAGLVIIVAVVIIRGRGIDIIAKAELLFATWKSWLQPLEGSVFNLEHVEIASLL